jgi:NADH-quinone oxidoreductase subunit F
VADALCGYLKIEPGEVSSGGEFTVEHAPCLGLCDHAPALLAGEVAIGGAAPAQAAEICARSVEKAISFVGGDIRILTSNCGQGYPTSLADYSRGGGYQGLKKALTMAPQDVLAEVKAAKLVGRGGAAFPTGIKWEGAANAAGQPKYIVCNADESEPGTFKDRVLMEEDPHRTIEGMIIAAHAVGARRGYIYIRGEYPYAFKVVGDAVDEARQAGNIGENIFGSGLDFEIEMRLGAGAYIAAKKPRCWNPLRASAAFRASSRHFRPLTGCSAGPP